MNANGKSHICSIDKRSFATKAALRQHRRDSHGGASAPKRVLARPSKGGRGRRPRNGGNCPSSSRTVSGVDVLAVTAKVTTSTAVGTILSEIKLSPSYHSSTRLEAESSLWARWKPVRLVLKIQPSAGAMTSGSYVVGHTFDLSETFSGTTGAVNRVMAMRPSASANIYSPIVFTIPSEMSQRWYLTGGAEEADSVHGKVVMVLSASLGNLTGSSSVSFMVTMNWEVTFEGAILPTTITWAGNVYVDPGYEGYHTTSVSDWASGVYLTLKHVSGGSAVPFSAAKPSQIYELDPSVKLNYVKSDGTSKGNIRWAVLIFNYSVKAFAVFDSKDNALGYAKTGNNNYCLKYYAAGDAVSPDNPAWIPISHVVKETRDDVDRLCRLVEQLLTVRGVPSIAPSESNSEFENLEDFQ